MGVEMANEKAPKTCVLIYGGHIEFGWHLQFVARARYKAQEYEHVIVHCEEPFRYLYEDFAHEIITYPVKHGLRDRWFYNKTEPKYSNDVAGIHAMLKAKYGTIKLFHPNESRCRRKEAKWFKYGQESIVPKHSILIHARNLSKTRYYDKRLGINRNWPGEKWTEFVSQMGGKGLTFVGSETGSRYFGLSDEMADMRDMPLKSLCGLMTNSKVIVGESSGPLHLAALCGCSVVVWTHRKREVSLGGHTNRDRYERIWNPLNTPVTVLDKWGWCPPVDEVVKAVEGYL
jgi:ADP-heptose:LPS heptosyltransferase